MKNLARSIGVLLAVAIAAVVLAANQPSSDPPRKDIPDYVVACDVILMGIDEAKICNLAVEQLNSEGKPLTAEAVADRITLLKQQRK